METHAVREIVPLPEIVPLDEAPVYVAGVINLRGQIVPILDLNVRFGHPPRPYRLDDCIVVLERAESAVGMVVNAVQSVRDVAAEAFAPLPSYESEAQPEYQFLSGLLKLGDQVVMRIDLENLLRLSQSLSDLRGAAGSTTPTNRFGGDASPEARAVFRERAQSLAQPLESPDGAGRLSLAVIRIGQELFGIELRTIREFVEVRGVTPVPCCPESIVGQMNIRGDLITLVDIAGVVGLPPDPARDRRKVIVVNSAELRAGVVADALLDVLTLNASDVTPVPTDGRRPDREYLRGMAAFGPRMLSLLDLGALLTHPALIVNEKP